MGINDPVTPNQSQEQKDKLREELDQHIRQYLQNGGKITGADIKRHNALRKKSPRGSILGLFND